MLPSFEESLRLLGIRIEDYGQGLNALLKQTEENWDPREAERALRAELLPFLCIASGVSLKFRIEWPGGVALDLEPREKIAIEAFCPPAPERTEEGTLIRIMGSKEARNGLFEIMTGENYADFADRVFSAKGWKIGTIYEEVEKRAIVKQLNSIRKVPEDYTEQLLEQAGLEKEKFDVAIEVLSEVFEREGYSPPKEVFISLFLPWLHAKACPLDSAKQRHPLLDQGNLMNLSFFFLLRELNRDTLDRKTAEALEEGYRILGGGRALEDVFGKEETEKAKKEIEMALNFLKSERQAV
jgi:hypothetical protein